MKKRRIALCLSLILAVQALAGCAADQIAADAEKLRTPPVADAKKQRTLPTAVVKQETGEKTVVEDLDAYEEMEILALDRAGDVKIYACETWDELKETIETLAATEEVSIVQPNYSYRNQALSVNDTLNAEQWALWNDGSFSIEEEKNRFPVYNDPFGMPSGPGEWRKPQMIGVVVEVATRNSTAGVDINISDAWARYGSGNRETVVAMIDTGVDYHHQDLAESIWINADEIPGNGIDDDGNGYVDDVNGWNFYHNNNQVFVGSEDSHGTHGAGTIVATGNNGIGITGIVPGGKVKVMPVKILGGSQGGGTTASLIKAIRYAQDNGAVICNLSLCTTTEDPALYQAISNSSMLFVVAAGNGSEETGEGLNADEVPFYPASYDLDNIITVANLTPEGNLHKSSNYGERSVDIAAPGSFILSATPGNNYAYMTGTSMAAPMAAGAAAMIYSYYDQISLADVKEILLSTARPMDSLQGITVSGGMPDVGAALNYDLSRLSGQGFTNAGTAPESGTAPYFEARISERSSGTFLVIRVVDVDGDLEKLAYAKGKLAKSDFVGGAAGMVFTLNAHDTATFQIGEPGTYTFYARDRKGNESIRVISITPAGDGPGD